MNRYLRLTCIASLLMLPLVSFSMYGVAGHSAGKASSKKSYVKKNAVKINKAYKAKETRIRKKAESMKPN